MKKVYCDSGGYDPRLKKLVEQVEVVNFDHGENKIKATKSATPSAIEYDASYASYDDARITYDEESSEKFESILNILGKNNLVDAKHLDAAYKSKCDYFFTRDKGDIINHREQIEKELGLKIYNPDKEFTDFLKNLNVQN